MDKKLTVIEAAKLLGVSKEAIYNRLRRGSLQSVVENGVKYILLTKNSLKEGAPARKMPSSTESAYVELLKLQLEEMKLKNEKLEVDKERLIADKERLLIESKEKIEMIYKERDEQLKAILTLANRQITHAPLNETVTAANASATDAFMAKSPIEDAFSFEEADVLDEEEEGGVVEDRFESYSDWRDLRSYLKEKGFSKKEKQYINDKVGQKVGQLNDVMDKNGKLFIKKGKKLKEILGE
ncbi:MULTISPECIES: helix-turn-helix domain-containing protein [unclassified Sulfurospirillum]|uniref:helix-turn-helix domain-containing protein n=1 Tax=unclassified Sulfurospirillum TaxID=2618290 RepID=UPI0005074367|nr:MULTISPECIES: helix-turn-helix domain-containing protein [unclassified Sulfurospirillum]KFL32980.1 integrase [Sulfurospirillum sp. SCADC]